MNFAQTHLFSSYFFFLHPPIFLSYAGIDSESTCTVSTELYNTWPVSYFQLMHTEFDLSNCMALCYYASLNMVKVYLKICQGLPEGIHCTMLHP